MEQTIKTYQSVITNGISPNIVAKELFQALKSEKFYIPTDSHLFVRGHVKRRIEANLRDFKKS